MSTTITKSPADKREYRYLYLDNKVRCLIINDSETDKSSASLDVKVGSSLDPEDKHGTAHFLEHMLFQGNEKYPDENEYMKYIADNGGYNNAFTSLTDTNYHFDCSNDGFEGALDRLAQFFISPCFSENSSEREKNAVDSEFKQAMQVDGWHDFHLAQTIAQPGSKFNKFQCGNLETLSKPGIRDSLLDFHKQWYSSNIMTLAVMGNHGLDKIEEWVREKFSPIVNKEVTVPSLVDPHPFPKGSLGKLVKIVPVQDKDLITFEFTLPYYELEYKSKPLNYFSHLFGHEGENSLLSYLISEGLALELNSYPHFLQRGFSNFCVEITMTKKGLENYEQVIEAFFQYAQKLKAAGPQDFVYQECRDLGNLQFEFMEKSKAVSTCVNLSGRMQNFEDSNMDQLIRSKYTFDEFNKQQIEDISEMICDPINCNVNLKSKSFEGTTDQEAAHFKTKYSIAPFSDALLKRMKEPNCEIKDKKIDLPPPNNLIPTKFGIKPEDEAHAKTPILLKTNDAGEYWYKKDDKFKRPKAIVSCKIFTADNGFGKTVEARMFANVWKNIAEEHLREFKYMADCADLSFSLDLLYDNIGFTWNGYDDSLFNFVQETMTKLIKMKDASLEKEFSQVKEKLLIDWKNAYLQQSYQMMLELRETIFYNNSFSKKEQRALLENYTYEQFMQGLSTWLTSGRFLVFVTGNYTKEEALLIGEGLTEKAGLKTINMGDIPPVQVTKLEKGACHVLEQSIADDDNENSCLLSVMETGMVEDNVKTKLLNQVTMQYISEPFFSDLRTAQQLGYVVHSNHTNHRDFLGSLFLIQSPTKSCEYQARAVNKFLVEFRKKMQDLTDEEFKQQKESVHTTIAEKDINLAKEHQRNWSELTTYAHMFDRQQIEIDELAKITKAEL
mmetsp:Transcript_1318/g.1693  ORF Transcript_1318/g.1693 Transcript_1318/m.1693 type:complete len:895 (-) Transcript_1318:261-2945(-)